MAARGLGGIARKYCNALMAYCDEHGGHEKLLAELESFNALYKKSGVLKALLESPVYSKQEKENLVQEVCKLMKLSEPILRLLIVLVYKGRISILDDLTARFRRAVDDKVGRVRGVVESAMELSEQERKQVIEALSAFCGKQALCDFVVNKDLIGGIRARVGSQLIDGSVKGRLERIRQNLKQIL